MSNSRWEWIKKQYDSLGYNISKEEIEERSKEIAKDREKQQTLEHWKKKLKEFIIK